MTMTDTNIYQFDDVEFGSADWQAMVSFVEANDIPVKTTPMRAKFWIGEDLIFIDQFYTNETGARMVSMLDTGFVKEERWFPLKRRPEEFGVKFTQAGRTSVEFPREV